MMSREWGETRDGTLKSWRHDIKHGLNSITTAEEQKVGQSNCKKNTIFFFHDHVRACNWDIKRSLGKD